MAILDLETVRSSPDARIFSGRDAGECARGKLQLDRLEKTGEHISIKIPENTMAVNLSFFLGLFGASIRRLGQDGFRARYEFITRAVHLRSIEEGIRKALLETSVFD